MPPEDERPRRFTKQQSFRMPSRFTNFSPASATGRRYDGSVGVKPITRATYRWYPVGAFSLLRAYSVGGDFIASLLSQRGIL